MVCTVLMFSSCVKKTEYYTFETDLGDTFFLKVYLSGNLKGMFPTYVIYEGDEKKTGCVLYVDRTDEGQMPDDPLSNITAIGTYGEHNFYKIFDELFYYRKGVFMDSISENFDVDYYEYEKKSPQMSYFIIHRVEAISDLMKSQKFEYIYKFGEIFNSSIFTNDELFNKFFSVHLITS